MTIEEARYRPFSYQPTLEDDCMDDEKYNTWTDNEEDIWDWWNYEENEPNGRNEEEMEYE